MAMTFGISGSSKRLNPCCNGRGSKTSSPNDERRGRRFVLILVVMEEGQRLRTPTRFRSMSACLNPCCNGRGSKTLRAST